MLKKQYLCTVNVITVFFLLVGGGITCNAGEQHGRVHQPKNHSKRLYF